MKSLLKIDYKWSLVALAISISANLLLVVICWSYFTFLNPVAVMGGRIDGRGGLWEIKFLVPFLVIAAIANSLLASQFTVLKKWAYGLIALTLFFGSACFMLTYFIRDLLK